MFKIDKSMCDADVTPQYMIDNIWIVGSPDDVAAQIRGGYTNYNSQEASERCL